MNIQMGSKVMLPSVQTLSDSDLIDHVRSLVADERKLTIEILHHLREIESRRLYAARGYGSLHEFVVHELKHSDGAAYRRIEAMRLMTSVPETEASLESGKLSLSTASAIQTFFKNEKRQSGKTYSKTEKLELISQLEGKTQRQCLQALAQISPQAISVERERVLTESQTEIRFVASSELMVKLEKIRSLASHRTSDPSYAGLFDLMADLALTKLEPLKSRTAAVKPDSVGPTSMSASPVVPVPASAQKFEEVVSGQPRRTRHVSAVDRREVWKQAGGKCTYTDITTGRRCESTHRLEIDHIQPFAQGGLNTAQNLRLYCQTHNQLAAIQAYGPAKMAQHRHDRAS